MGMFMTSKRYAYMKFATVYKAISQFNYNQNEETTENLKNAVKHALVGMPLPSGRYGDSLAIALEMQMYKAALYMIKNASELGINLDYTSSLFGGSELWNAQETFEFSQMDFDTKKVSCDDELYKEFSQEVIEAQNANIDAASEIATIMDNTITKGLK